MQKLNILHVCDKFGAYGSTTHGASRLFEWWVPKFNHDKYNITVCGLKPPDKASERLINLGMDVICIGKYKYDFTILFKLFSLVNKKEIDVLHVHGFGATNFGRIVAILKNRPLIIHEHAYLPNVSRLQIIIDKILSPVLYKAIAVSLSVRKFLIDIRKINPRKICVIYNGAPLEKFQGVEPKYTMEQKKLLSIPLDNYVLGIVGRLHIQKGHRYLLEAMPVILKKFPKTTLIIVGDGLLKDELVDLCKKLNLEKNVIFTGHLENMDRVISAFDIQMFPSLWEGTPLTVFEAMAMGKVIVASGVDGLKEVLINNETAVLIPPKEPQEIANAVIQLLQNPEKRKLLGQNAKRSSLKYDIKNTVYEMEKIYDEIAAIKK